jgi:hypothetical protein
MSSYCPECKKVVSCDFTKTPNHDCVKYSETRVVNIQNEDYDVLIDRTTKWGNKFKVKEHGRKKSISLYKNWILNNKKLMNCLPELKGKRLGCHCKPDICHGDVLVELVKEYCK